MVTVSVIVAQASFFFTIVTPAETLLKSMENFFFASTSETIVSISSVVKVFKTLLSFTRHIFVTSPLFLTHLEVNLFPYTEKWMYGGGDIRTAGSKHEPADLK